LKPPTLPPEYTLQRVLGRSALSEVFLIRKNTGELYALKLLRVSASRDPRLLIRFEREAQLLQDLRHPNLVEGYGFLKVDGRAGLLLEFISGPTLRDLLEQGSMGWEQVARFGMQLSRALDMLHRNGALHRDVKPHNILVHPIRGAVLADLGLVRRTEDPELTRQGAALGSPAYMSPEQTRDPSGVGPEADVYSLGATLHHALSGVPPFLGKGVGEVIHRVLHLDPEPLPPEVPDPLQKVLGTAMAKDQEKRYERARDLGGDLARVLLGNPPNLVTRFQRKARRRIAVVAFSTPLILLGGMMLADHFGWMESRSEPDNPIEIETTADPQAGENGPDAGLPGAHDSQAMRRLFLGWSSYFMDRYQSAYEDGAYRRAWQHLNLYAAEDYPAGADPGFMEQLRREQISRGRDRLENRANETFVDVAEVLHAQSEIGRNLIEAGQFEADAWTRSTLQVLYERVPRARQLPMFQGGDNPSELVYSYRLTLERQNKESWSSRARELVPVIRPKIDQLLRQGALQEAWLVWNQMDTRLLAFSLEARREGWRMEQLVEAERRLAALMAGRLGRDSMVPLVGGTLQGRVCLPQENQNHWQLQDAQGQRTSVHLLRLDPARLGEFLSLSKSQASWLSAQLYWCQGDYQRATDLARELALQEWSAEADPYFWVREWERWLGLRSQPGQLIPAQAEPAVGSDTEVEINAETADPLSPFEVLRNELSAKLLGARFEQHGNFLRVMWTQPSWNPSWLRTWQLEPRKWRIKSWGVEWKIPLATQPPDQLSLWGDIKFERHGQAWDLNVADKRVEGVQLVPGALQTLQFDGQEVRFDDIKYGPWQAPKARRILLRASASGPFQPIRVWVDISAVHP
jgi:protein kinase-like protein